MSAQMLVKAMETRDLTPAERLVLFSLADCADREGRNAFKSERSIAEHMQLSVRTVKRGLQSLKTKGHISIQELPTNRRSTTYQLFPSELASGDRLSPQSGEPSNRGDIPSPPRARTRGDIASPRGGDNPSPLGVTRGVTFTTAGGDKSALPPTPPYKEDPVFDPADPGIVSLLTKVVHGIWEGLPTLDGESLIDSVRRYARARRWPHDTTAISQAIDRARQERQRRAS